MVSVACFDVRDSVMFHLMFVHYTFILFGLLSGYLSELPARLAIYSHCLLSICTLYLFPIWFLRAGFGF